MERRAFIKSTCNMCGLMAAGFLLPALTGCGPAAYKVVSSEIVNNRIELPLASFTQSPLQVVRPKGWLYSIAVRKKEDNTWSALLMKCTHQDNQLMATGGNGYTCSLHGSTFNTEGRVIKGPAERPLRSYPITAGADNVTIEIRS